MVFIPVRVGRRPMRNSPFVFILQAPAETVYVGHRVCMLVSGSGAAMRSRISVRMSLITTSIAGLLC